ncbi:uncharacterized protein LOC124920892 isoform X2 [Impatiens glandulifera]|uniref:uncharacterized protein LOC124920892 isoform X2 n=1 Tax=Impatiens glandulifera TaxID=253017 RepID=UPI001FB1677B|nr:uncharacterized protein LOC124920892 isoform X2 [Impatiens glandulifera]
MRSFVGEDDAPMDTDYDDEAPKRKEDEDEEEEEMDPFGQFINYVTSILLPDNSDDDDEEPNGPGWSWIASRILKTCIAYSSGVTSAILLSELSQAWNEQNRIGAPKKQPECISMLKKNKRSKLPNTVTIDSIYEKKFLSLNSVLEAIIIDAFVLPGTNIYMLSLGDFWSSNTIELYLHRRFYNLADTHDGILKKGREVFLTGCRLRPASSGSGCLRLLPTEYFITLLNEDEDDDAMLLGAQFCSDSFSNISVDAINEGTSYSLYARIEYIGPVEIQGKDGIQRKQIALVDNDGIRMKFLLWGEQVLLADLFSLGSMLALDKPFVATFTGSATGRSEELCLEYGSATQLYLVPFIQHEEQVSVALTQTRTQGSKFLSTCYPSQMSKISQVVLPCDSKGSIDFRNYPFRISVSDLRDKMTGFSLYGIVSDMSRDTNSEEVVFSLRIEDKTGAIWVKLHFSKSWSLGRVGLGHTVYLSGLSCSYTGHKCLEVIWSENNIGVSFVNLSCLPALVNSSCLHVLSTLSNLQDRKANIHVCQIQVDQVEYCHVNTRYSHSPCGHFVSMTSAEAVCKFCHQSCSTAEVESAFHLKITLADESGKVLAWCTGQTAVDLLQISPDEFNELPEEEQIIYPSSLESERFRVSLVNCRRPSPGNNLYEESDTLSWEITRAIKYS